METSLLKKTELIFWRPLGEDSDNFWYVSLLVETLKQYHKGTFLNTLYNVKRRESTDIQVLLDFNSRIVARYRVESKGIKM